MERRKEGKKERKKERKKEIKKEKKKERKRESKCPGDRSQDGGNPARTVRERQQIARR